MMVNLTEETCIILAIVHVSIFLSFDFHNALDEVSLHSLDQESNPSLKKIYNTLTSNYRPMALT